MSKSKGFYTGFVSAVETAISSDSVTGDQEFDLEGHAPRNNVVDYFYFVDGGGDQVDASAGTVTVTLSPGPEGDEIFQDIQGGSFVAATARDANWPKPNGFGKASKIKISFTGITGAVGFRAHVSQSMS